MRCVVSFMHVYLAAIGLDVLPGYAEDTTESTAAEPLVSGCRPISRRAAHVGRASERDVSWHMGQLRVGNPSGCPILHVLIDIDLGYRHGLRPRTH